MNKYEAMLIVKPDLAEEEKKILFKHIEDAATKHKCEISHAAVWSERRKFFFPINKYQEGIYYLLAFQGPAEAIKDIRLAYRLNENILRLLFTRMD